MFGDFVVPNLQLFSNQDLENEQLAEIERKVQAKNTRKTTEWGVKNVREMVPEKKNYSGCQNNKLKSNGLE